jgi:hypothetical protein
LQVVLHVDVAPLEFGLGQGHAVLGDVLDLAFALDVAGGLFAVVAERGALVPVLMRFDEVLVVADHFAIGAAWDEAYCFFFFSSMRVVIICFLPSVSTGFSFSSSFSILVK